MTDCPVQVTCERVKNPSCPDCNFRLKELSCPGYPPFDGTLSVAADEADYFADPALAPGDYVFTFKVAVVGTTDADLMRTFDVTFTLIDPCSAPRSMEINSLRDQHYIVTDRPLVYEFSTVTQLEPSFCPLSAELTASTFKNCDREASNAVTLESDTDSSKSISIYWDKDLSPIGEPQVVTLTVTSKSRFGSKTPPLTRTSSFRVVFENPCLHKRLVTMQVDQHREPVPDRYTNSQMTV